MLTDDNINIFYKFNATQCAAPLPLSEREVVNGGFLNPAFDGRSERGLFYIEKLSALLTEDCCLRCGSFPPLVARGDSSLQREPWVHKHLLI